MLRTLAASLALTLCLSTAHAADLTESDRQNLSLLENILETLSSTKNVEVRASKAEIADANGSVLELKVLYPPADKIHVVGPGGKTMRAIQILFNELSIARDRDRLKRIGKTLNLKKFSTNDRNLIVVPFVQDQE